MQELHSWQVVTETNGELDYIDIDSEDTEITEDLFGTLSRNVHHFRKITIATLTLAAHGI